MHVVGLTSRRASRVRRVHRVCTTRCSSTTTRDRSTRASAAVVVDMSGNADVLRRVHHHFGDHLTYSCRVGATHWDAGGSVDGLPGAAPTFFFAPSQIKVRSQEWGREVFESRVGEALADFLRHAAGWMTVQRGTGVDGRRARVPVDLGGRERAVGGAHPHAVGR